MENILVSACLLGFECKYCGGSNRMAESRICALQEKYRLIPVCPESAGGLPTPRLPSERLGDRVLSSRGDDVTAQFEKGARCALVLAERYACKKALLKANSPSCGSGTVYDGTFSGKLVSGDGLSTEKLRKHGIEVYTEQQLEKIL